MSPGKATSGKKVPRIQIPHKPIDHDVALKTQLSLVRLTYMRARHANITRARRDTRATQNLIETRNGAMGLDVVNLNLWALTPHANVDQSVGEVDTGDGMDTTQMEITMAITRDRVAQHHRFLEAQMVTLILHILTREEAPLGAGAHSHLEIVHIALTLQCNLLHSHNHMLHMIITWCHPQYRLWILGF